MLSYGDGDLAFLALRHLFHSGAGRLDRVEFAELVTG